ncbi:hypothetical protein GGR51DRAFT_506308 [Nemania sp. FL0031]|nr:hypothetical protein GGR51DRAFT_506308 [Nemania sp. FL0031]
MTTYIQQPFGMAALVSLCLLVLRGTDVMLTTNSFIFNEVSKLEINYDIHPRGQPAKGPRQASPISRLKYNFLGGLCILATSRIHHSLWLFYRRFP